MKCPKCDGEMKQLLTSFFCPSCEGDGGCCSKGKCKDSAISKLDDKDNKKSGCGGSCGGSCGGYPGGHSLHSVKEDYVLYGPIKAVRTTDNDDIYLFSYYDVSFGQPAELLINRHTMTSGCLALTYSFLCRLEKGYRLYRGLHNNKYHMVAPGFSWDDVNGKWVKGK